MKINFLNCLLLTLIITMFSNCENNDDETIVFSVIYNGNNNTGGVVPTDSSKYEEGEIVTIAYPGSMQQTGYIFASWNTQIDGGGSNYMPQDKLKMPSNDVMLHAQWEFNPKSPFVTCAQEHVIRNSINVFHCSFNNGFHLDVGNSYWIRMSIGFAHEGENGEAAAYAALPNVKLIVELENDTLPVDGSAVVEYNPYAGFWEVNTYHCTGILDSGYYNITGTSYMNDSFEDQENCILFVE